ncbi:MAG: CHAT domain-containing protein [Caulobacter sp.]
MIAGALMAPAVAAAQDSEREAMKAMLEDETGISPYTLDLARDAVDDGKIDKAKEMLRGFVQNYAEFLRWDPSSAEEERLSQENGGSIYGSLVVACYGYLATLEARGGDRAAYDKALATCRELQGALPKTHPRRGSTDVGEVEYLAYGLGVARWVCCALDATLSTWFAERLRAVQTLPRPATSPPHVTAEYVEGLALAGYCDIVMKRYDAAHGFLDQAEEVANQTLQEFAEAVGLYEGQQTFRGVRAGFRYALNTYITLCSLTGRQVDRAARASQWLQISATGESLRKAAARLAAGSGALAQLIRERESLISKLDDWDADRSSDEAYHASLERLVEGRDRLARIDKRITDQFPRYKSLASPTPTTIDSLQGALAKETVSAALVVYVALSDRYCAFVVRPGRNAKLVTLTGARSAIDAGATRLRQSVMIQDNRLATYPLDVAHTLWTQIFAPLEADLKGTTRLYVVPQGALEGLPLGLLVSSPPPPPGVDSERYRGAAWLTRRFAFVTLPDAGALTAFQMSGESGRRPFLGFGDPKLPPASPSPQAMSRNITILRDGRLVALPETKQELIDIATALGGGRGDVLVQEAATEREVFNQNNSGALADVRILAFATHGLAAADAAGANEPSLVLSPPGPGQPGDGFLSQSEILTLRLNAQLVVLSACETASSDGAPTGRPLSGLCRAFLYAGARSVLATHWKVASQSISSLVVETAAARRNRPEALQSAMVRMIESSAAETHPFYWAPFVLVGRNAS